MGGDEIHSYRVSKGETVSRGLLRALDGVHEGDLADLSPPLTTVIDLDAIDRLFPITHGGAHGGDARIVFTFHEYRVTVHNYGVIEVSTVGFDEIDERIDN